MSTRLHTQDPTKRLTYLGVRQRAIREHLLQRLTEKQYRRVALLYGFDGEPMSLREVAAAEEVAHPTVLESKEQVLSKLSQDVYLWLLWVVRKLFNPTDPYTPDKGGRGMITDSEARRLREGYTNRTDIPAMRRDVSLTPKAVKPDDLPYDQKQQRQLKQLPLAVRELIEAGHGFTVGNVWGGWESDRYHPESRYDRQVDELNEKYETGQITRIEWEVELLLAYVEDQNPKASEFRMDDLRQEMEWAFGGQELGVYSEEKTQQLVSAALRSYVNRE